MAATSFNDLKNLSNNNANGEMSEMEVQKFNELQSKMAELKDAMVSARADADRSRAEVGEQWDQPTQVEWAKPKTLAKEKSGAFAPTKARLAPPRRTPKNEPYVGGEPPLVAGRPHRLCRHASAAATAGMAITTRHTPHATRHTPHTPSNG